MKLVLLLALVLAGCTKLNASCSGHAAEKPLAGGAAGTIESIEIDAFALPMPILTTDQERAFFKGRALFRDLWLTAPASARSRDGLGPFFNARSCEGCHVRDGRGRPPLSPEEPSTSMLIRLSVPGATPESPPVDEPVYGGQLQPLSIDGIPAEGTVHVSYTELPGTYGDGEPFTLRKPSYRIDALGYGPLHAGVMMSPRVAPPMTGLGLLEAIPEATLLGRTDPDDLDGDGISGRANWTSDARTQARVIGRFGWKATKPTVEAQAAGAFNGDLGITSELNPKEDCTDAQAACKAAPTGGTPELDPTILANVAFYSRTLAVPARRGLDDAQVRRGEELFQQSGCASCHTPMHVTGPFPPVPALAGQTIHPYSDLLLHDMGDGLADGRPDILANGREWRTPPLWGIGLLEKVNEHGFLLHDGRARNAAEAILWHGGEAEAAKEKFRTMPRDDRDALLAFLGSL